MAVSKNTRRSPLDTNQVIDGLFRESQISGEREHVWRQAMHHAESGTPPLRFPLYEHLYLVNVSAQKLVDLLREIGERFGIDKEQSLYHQLLIQGVRSTISRQVVEHMARVEHIDSWQFEGQRRIQERKF
jgi:hypothetical protein